ncbi:MAG: DUF2842 domain-containing protein [Beijerinckiaceae bacterium]|nr:DUF2842 domain-containing protein [Beijerinckiaceae bacterium]
MRSLIGTILMVVFVMLYAFALTLLSPLILRAASESLPDVAFKIVQALYYLVAGLAWVLPLLPLVKWMTRPDKPAANTGAR